MTLQFKITLLGSQKPPIWRRLLAPDTLTFSDFHAAIQIALGWENSHLYEFNDGRGGNIQISGDPMELFASEAGERSTSIRLNALFKKPKQKLFYIYDFGDYWQHEVLLEKLQEEVIPIPMLLDGKGACPPEDCGGIHGYYQMVAALNTPSDPSKSIEIDYHEWLGLEEGETWDVHEFELGETNELLTEYFDSP